METVTWSTIITVLFCIVVFIALLMYVLPHYKVWSAHKRGLAELALATNEQQVQVMRAQGRKDAATLNMEAEVIDATAVQKSVDIIGKALHNNEGYLRWKWIHMMENTDNSTIYVPTECGLPILEAGKRATQEQVTDEQE